MVHFWSRSARAVGLYPARPMLQTTAGGTSPTLAAPAPTVAPQVSSVAPVTAGGGRGIKSSRSGGPDGVSVDQPQEGGGNTALGLLSRLGQYKRRQHQQHKQRVAERELDTLHHRIDKMLARMEHRDSDTPLDDEEECVVCLGARATMQTFPCQHRVVCRKCFIRTIQVAVCQRSLPLRCVVCRARILKLRHGSQGSKAVIVTAAPGPPGCSPEGDAFLICPEQTVRAHVHGVTSLGKVAPAHTTPIPVQATPNAFFLHPEPPRLTLTKADNLRHQQLSSLTRACHVTSTSAPSLSVRRPVSAATSAKAETALPQTNNRKEDQTLNVAGHDVTSNATGKGANSHCTKRGRIFPFKALFWRQ